MISKMLVISDAAISSPFSMIRTGAIVICLEQGETSAYGEDVGVFGEHHFGR